MGLQAKVYVQLKSNGDVGVMLRSIDSSGAGTFAALASGTKKDVVEFVQNVLEQPPAPADAQALTRAKELAWSEAVKARQ